VLPRLTDSTEHLDDLLGRIAAAGATGVTVFGLHLRGSTRGWFMQWLQATHPELVFEYRRLYRRGAYLPADYRDELRTRVAPLVARYGLTGRATPPMAGAGAVSSEVAAPAHPTLF
jgi:DNA repair photolyase